MVSGAFIIEKQDPFRTIFQTLTKNRSAIHNLGALYFLWRIHKRKPQMAQFPCYAPRGPIYYHLWFIYVLIGLYIIAPVLGAYVKGASRKNQSYLLFLVYYRIPSPHASELL